MRHATLAITFSLFALFASACANETEPTPSPIASQTSELCGYAEVDTAVCDRTTSLGTCSEYRTSTVSIDEMRSACEDAGGTFATTARCSRGASLMGVCPTGAPDGLVLHYYYAGEIFADEAVPVLACDALSPDGWCSGE